MEVFIILAKILLDLHGVQSDQYAKTAREFKDELAAHLGVTSKELTVRHREGIVYRDYTLNPEAAANYSRGVTYCSASPEEEFLN